MINRLVYSLLAVFPFAFLACDGGTGAGAGGSGLTANIDGMGWEAEANTIVAQANAGVTGSVMLLGSQTGGGKTRSLTLTVYNVGGPGKYALGVGSDVFGGTGLVGEGTGGGGNADSWITPGTGVAGEVEIVSMDGGRITGGFSYTAVPGKGNATGSNRVVTDGKFDLPLKGTVAPLAENLGSKVTAKLNGVFYNAYMVLGGLTDFTGGAGVTLSSTSDLNSVSINLVGVTRTGKYALNNFSPQRLITAGRTGGTAGDCCWGTTVTDSGEVIVTSLTAKRVQGTFTATLRPQKGKPATADLVVTDGTFDVGIP